MKSLTIKIFVVVGLLLVMSTSAGLFGFAQLRVTVGTYSDLIDQDMANEVVISKSLLEFKTQVQEWKNTLLRGSNTKQREKYWAAFQRRETAVQTYIDQLLITLPANTASRDLVEQFKAAHITMGQGYRNGFADFESNNYSSAAGDAAVKGMDREPARLLVEATESIAENVRQSLTNAESQYHSAMRLSLAIFSLIAILGFLGAAWLARSVVRQIGGDPSQALSAVFHIAEGNLSSAIPVRSGDKKSLMAALENMRTRLLDMVGQVRQSSVEIANGSSHIADGAADQSTRIDNLTESLKDTATSMNELSTTLEQNATNANEADHLAQQASEVAQKGGEVVAQVVETMQHINTSSKQISDITGVIDGIAFQTNLLALNAAVEAARAGADGRGFAVVASEVGALAKRSADAANEIKKLIGASVQRVERGGQLVDQAGSTMEEVVSSITQVTTLIGEISIASAQQNAAVQDVSNAVSSMDQATQQSARVVEESATSAANLRIQSDELANAVAQFQSDTDSESVAT